MFFFFFVCLFFFILVLVNCWSARYIINWPLSETNMRAAGARDGQTSWALYLYGKLDNRNGWIIPSSCITNSLAFAQHPFTYFFPNSYIRKSDICLIIITYHETRESDLFSLSTEMLITKRTAYEGKKPGFATNLICCVNFCGHVIAAGLTKSRKKLVVLTFKWKYIPIYI